MRAVIVKEFGPIESVVLGTIPAPVPKRGEVVVEIHATAVNYVDQLVIGGKYQFLPKPPFVPGKGPSGIVVSLGEGTTRFKVATGCWR